jgi:capsular polysaccharide biosynthesis protein
MGLNDLSSVLRRRWLTISSSLLVLTTAATVFMAAVLLSPTAPTRYEASVSLFVTTPTKTTEADQGSLFSARQRAASYSELTQNSRQLAADVISDLRLRETPDELKSRVSAEVIPETVIVKLTVTDADAATAHAIARAYAENLIGMSRGLKLVAGVKSPRRT